MEALMPSVINLNEKKRFSPAHDEWATIGVHLATRVDQGATVEQATAALVALGVDQGRIRRYLKREGLHHPGRLSVINALYTREENAAILQWLEYQISSRWKYEDKWGLSFNVAKILLYEQNGDLYEMLEEEQRADGEPGLSDAASLRRARANRAGLLHTTYLCEINWANTAPGLSWPEYYQLTFLPGYNIDIMTAGQCSLDVYGYYNVALNFTPRRKDGTEVKDVGLRAVEAWWLRRSDASPWEELFNAGSLDERALFRFRSKIWPGEYEFYEE
jgi:hypothetical protein